MKKNNLLSWFIVFYCTVILLIYMMNLLRSFGFSGPKEFWPLDLGDMAAFIGAIGACVTAIFIYGQLEGSKRQFSLASVQTSFFGLYDEKKIREEEKCFISEYECRQERNKCVEELRKTHVFQKYKFVWIASLPFM